MENKNIAIKYILALVLLLSVTLVSAQEFAHTQQCAEVTGTGLILSVGHPIVGKIGEDIVISIIVYDANGKIKTSSDTTCTVGLIDSQGAGIVLINETDITIIPAPINAWQAVFTASNFTETSNFGFIARCDIIQAGGCFEAHFQVTENGEIISPGAAILYSLFSLFIFGMLCIMAFFIIVLPYENEKDAKGFETKVVRIKYLRPILMVTLYLSTVLMLNFLNGLAVNFSSLLMFSGTLGFLFETMMSIARPFTIVMIVWIVYMLIQDSNVMKNLDKFVDIDPFTKSK